MEGRVNERLSVRQDRFGNDADAQRIFPERMLEMIPDTAFRALRHHPKSLLLYLCMLILSFLLIKSLSLTCCLALLVLLARFHYSRRVILGCLERSQNTDMSDIEKYNLKSPASRMKGRVIERLSVRQYRFEDDADVQRIFREGMLEMIPDTAFRALRHHPESLLLYLCMLILSFLLIESLSLTCCLALLVLLARFHYSRRVILGCLERSQNTDMSDIEKYYLKSPGSNFWVAVLEGRVVGIVAVRLHRTECLELLHMSVDRHWRKSGIGSILGRTVLEFARQFAHTTSSTSSILVTLGTTAYTPAAHRLYRSLGFCHVGTMEGYTIPDDDGPVWQWLFYRVRHHYYRYEM